MSLYICPDCKTVSNICHKYCPSCSSSKGYDYASIKPSETVIPKYDCMEMNCVIKRNELNNLIEELKREISVLQGREKKTDDYVEELKQEIIDLRNQRDNLSVKLSSAELYIKDLKNEVESEDDDLRRVCGKRVDNLDKLIDMIRRA